jgi:hypothetical protein
MCLESKTTTGNLESNAYGSVHSLSYGPTRNVAPKFAELGRTLRDLPSAVACRASTESGSMIYMAAVCQAFRPTSAVIGRFPIMPITSVTSIRSSDEERTTALYSCQHKGYQNNAFTVTDLFVHQCVVFHIDTLCSLSHITPGPSTKVAPPPCLKTKFSHHRLSFVGKCSGSTSSKLPKKQGALQQPQKHPKTTRREHASPHGPHQQLLLGCWHHHRYHQHHFRGTLSQRVHGLQSHARDPKVHQRREYIQQQLVVQRQHSLPNSLHHHLQP